MSARRPPEDVRSRVVQQDNYVLMGTKMVSGDAPAGAPGPLLYMIRGLKKPDLAKLVGQRAQVEGKFDKVARAKNPVMFAYDLVELKGTAIKQVEGECGKP